MTKKSAQNYGLFSSFHKYGARHFLAIVSVVLFFLIADISITGVSNILGNEQLASAWGIASFLAIATVFAVGQYLILDFVKAKNKELKVGAARVSIVGKVVTIVQYVITAIIGIVAFQVVVISQYYTVLVIPSVSLSYGLAGVIMLLLSIWFFSWYRSSKDIVTLLYGLSSVTVSISSIIMLVFFDIVLFSKSSITNSQSEVIFPFFEPTSTLGITQYSFFLLNILTFLLLWGSTALLLRHYSRRVGRIRLWTILAIPLVIWLGSFYLTPLVFQSVSPDANLTYITIFAFVLPAVAVGILFGVPFWIVSRRINHPGIRNHMIITACGFVLFFVSGTSNIGHTPYPAFGLVGVSFLGLSTYLILTGLYSSVIAISEDSKLRRSIRQSVREESKLLGSLGTAQMQNEIKRKVTEAARGQSDIIQSKTGLPPPLTEDEMTDYIESVLREISSVKDVDTRRKETKRDQG